MARIPPGEHELDRLYYEQRAAYDTLMYFQDNPSFRGMFEYVRTVGRPGIQVGRPFPSFANLLYKRVVNHGPRD